MRIPTPPSIRKQYHHFWLTSTLRELADALQSDWFVYFIETFMNHLIPLLLFGLTGVMLRLGWRHVARRALFETVAGALLIAALLLIGYFLRGVLPERTQ